MASSRAPTVKAYLKELPADVRRQVERVREVIVANLPDGYVETMNWGMICYEVPLQRYPDTYNRKPLAYVALAAQKNYNSLYLTCAYIDKPAEAKLRGAFRAAGKKLDMGKSCIRFRSADDLPLAVIGQMIAEVPVERFIACYEKARSRS